MNEPPRTPPDEVEETIEPENPVDEALYETFPASDPPGHTEGDSVSADDYKDDEPGPDRT